MPGSITPLPIFDQPIPEAELPPSKRSKPVIDSLVIRYSYQKKMAELPYDGEARPGCGAKVVARTERGIELAEVVTTTCPNGGCGNAVTRDEMVSYIRKSGDKDYPMSRQGKVLRIATHDDTIEQQKLDAGKRDIIRSAKQHIAELELEMNLVEVECLLGGERIVFYYTAEDWVDFRELVKRLAADHHTRIEMCQVNAREEARIVADYEKCGQHCCCKQFLKVLKPISMRSAKIQKATLDPQKISGRCGRLMCCLRYEDQTYEQLRKQLPHKKTVVETEDGVGIVVGSQILTQLVLVSLDTTQKVQAYPLEDIRKLSKEEAAERREQAEQQAQTRQDRYASRRSRDPRPPRDPRDDNEAATADDAADPNHVDQGDTDGSAISDPDSENSEQRKPRRRRRKRRRGGGDNTGGDEGGSNDASQAQAGGDDPSSGDDEGAPKKKRRRRRRRRKPRGDGGDGADSSSGGGGDDHGDGD